MKDRDGIRAGTSISTRWVRTRVSLPLWMADHRRWWEHKKQQVVRGFFQQNDPAYPRMTPEEMVSLPWPPYLCLPLKPMTFPFPAVILVRTDRRISESLGKLQASYPQCVTRHVPHPSLTVPLWLMLGPRKSPNQS
jgi:hypothetical protein